MTTLLIVLYFINFGEITSTSQTMQFESMKSCEQAKVAMTESVVQFKNLQQFHIGCYNGKQ